MKEKTVTGFITGIAILAIFSLIALLFSSCAIFRPKEAIKEVPYEVIKSSTVYIEVPYEVVKTSVIYVKVPYEVFVDSYIVPIDTSPVYLMGLPSFGEGIDTLWLGKETFPSIPLVYSTTDFWYIKLSTE